jgi:hypothetical protein
MSACVGGTDHHDQTVRFVDAHLVDTDPRKCRRFVIPSVATELLSLGCFSNTEDGGAPSRGRGWSGGHENGGKGSIPTIPRSLDFCPTTIMAEVAGTDICAD